MNQFLFIVGHWLGNDQYSSLCVTALYGIVEPLPDSTVPEL